MRTITYAQTLVIGVVFTALGYFLISHHVGLGNFIAVIGDVGIVFSLVMLIKTHFSKGKK
jgi:hypothetical protein